jgi:hypothetical protein
MHVGTSVHIGNEMAATSLSALSVRSCCACWRIPKAGSRSARRAAGAGAALLFSAALVALAAVGTLAILGVARCGWRPRALRLPAVTGAS